MLRAEGYWLSETKDIWRRAVPDATVDSDDIEALGAFFDTVDEALARLAELRPPTEAVLVQEGKYHRIKRVRFERPAEEQAA